VTGIVPGSLTLEVAGVVDDQEVTRGSRTVTVVESPLGPTISGDDSIPLGQSAEFTYSETDTLSDPVWVFPDGSEAEGASIEITPDQAGRFTIILTVTDPDGNRIGAKKTIELG
jgi:hypothetical protein